MARKKLQKFFALLLTFSMSMSLLSVGAFAAENDGGEKIQLSSVTLPDDSPAEIDVAFGTSEEDLNLPDYVLGTVEQEEVPPVEDLLPPEVPAVEGEGDVVQNPDGSGDAAQNPDGSGDAAQNPGDSGDTAQNPGDSGDAAQNPGDSGDTAQNPGDSGDTAQNPGDSGDAAQNPGDSGDAAQNPGDSGDAAQNPGDSGDAAQNPGDSGDAAQNPGDSGDAAQNSGDSGNVSNAQQGSQENTLSATDAKMDPAPEDTEDPEEISVTWTCEAGYTGWIAGTYKFTAQLDSRYAYEGSLPTVTVTVADQAKYVAEINGTPYETLQKAMDAAKEEGYNNITITLLGNVLLDSNVVISIPKDTELELTIDLNHYEITGDPSASVRIYTQIATPDSSSVKMLTVKNGILSGLRAPNGAAGGALSCYDNLTVENCVFQNNESKQGGAISLSPSDSGGTTTLTVKNSTFIGNKSSGSGGAIHAASNGTSVFEDVTFIGNSCDTSSGLGGALYMDKGTIEISDCSFRGNAACYGGAVGCSQAAVTVKNSTFTSNSAAMMGGAIHIQGLFGAECVPGTLNVSGGSFRDNSAKYGGAISVTTTGGSLVLSDSTVSSNTADIRGGAIYTQDGCTIDITTDLTDNSAGSNGGAVYASQGTLTVTGDLTGNHADYDGGAIYAQTTTVTVNGNLTDNSAGRDGGAICLYQYGLTLNGDATGNSAGGNGGAIYSIWSTVDLNGTVSGNSATGNGGGVYTAANEAGELYDGKINLLDASVYNNTADEEGADIWQGSGNQMDLKEVGSDWVLEECGHDIDGWYYDEADARWSAEEKPLSAWEFTEFERNGIAMVDYSVALRAAHGLIPVDPEDPNLPDWEISKSKTATNLDDNYESQVTLSLPAAQEALASDIVFVVDKSTSSREASTDGGLDMLSDLAYSLESTQATINVGIIVFDGTYHVMRELSPYDAADVAEKMSAPIPAEEDTSGTNMEAGLLAAKTMLEADDRVPDNRKHVILVSDGLTRLFTGPDGETVQIIFNELEADGTRYFGEYTTWCLSNGFSDGEYKIPGGTDWLTYYNNVIKPQVEADGDTYVMDFDGDSTKVGTAPDRYIPMEEVDDHAQAIDRAFYDAYQAYLDLSSTYHFYAFYTGNSELGSGFMSTLNHGEDVDFGSIRDGIYYLLDAGSKVVDVIGYGTDNKGNEYDFDFVNDISALTLTVNGEELPARELDVTDGFFTGSHETACYVFGDLRPMSLTSGYPFALHYYANGEDGQSDECFVWEINVPVSNFAPVELTYSVKLTNPQTADGTYGHFDADGSEHFDSLLTNLSAVLYPVDSNGDQGMPEYFAKPTVSYTNTTPGGGGGGGGDDDDDDDDGGTNIPDENTPTTDVPGTDIPDENTPTTDVPGTDLEDPDVPLADVPKTGDMSALWLALSALSGTGLAGVTFLGRKKRDEE